MTTEAAEQRLAKLERALRVIDIAREHNPPGSFAAVRRRTVERIGQLAREIDRLNR